MARQIGTLGTIDTVTVGGRVMTDITNLIMLNGILTGSNATLRKGSASAGYAVTALKTYTPTAIRIYNKTGGTSTCDVAVFQSDNDLGTAGTAATNPVYQGNSTSFINVMTLSGSAGTTASDNINSFSIAAGKYVSVLKGPTSNGDSHVYVYGYET